MPVSRVEPSVQYRVFASNVQSALSQGPILGTIQERNIDGEPVRQKVVGVTAEQLEPGVWRLKVQFEPVVSEAERCVMRGIRHEGDKTTCFNCDNDVAECACGDCETYGDSEGPLCPFCGHLNSAADSDGQLYDESTDEYECGECSKLFRVSICVTHSWHAYRPSA